MASFVSGADRTQGTLFPAQLEDYVAENNPVRMIDFFVDQLDLGRLGLGAFIRSSQEGPLTMQR